MSNSLGTLFEDRALAYLRRQGLRLVARNVRFSGGELDLVMRDPRGVLVFVEVRARASLAFGGALASIGVAKQRRLRLAAALYLARRQMGGAAPPPCRFDVIGFEGSKLVWLVDAFGAAPWR